MSCLFCTEMPTRMFGGKVLICDEHYNDFIEEQQLWYKGLLTEEDREMMLVARKNGYYWKWDTRPKESEDFTKEELQELFDEGKDDSFCMAYFNVKSKEYQAFLKKHKMINPNDLQLDYNGLTIEKIKEHISNGLITMEISKREKVNYEGLRSFLKKIGLENPNKGKVGKHK